MNINDLKAKVGGAADFLVTGERTVGELEAVAGLSQSALSQHLAKPREAKPVTTRREAQTIYYRLANRGEQRPIDVLYDLYCRPSRRRRS